MFEPITLTVAELAARWDRSPRQVLEYAQHVGIPLYFKFAGLAFDEADVWHRFLGDQWLQEELRHLNKAIKAAEEQIIRARDGQLSRWEQLPVGGIPQLRAEINAMQDKKKEIEARLEQREEERARCTCAFLRAGPGTLKLIADDGDVVFPRWAFHPETSITARQIQDERGNYHLTWSGRMMCLEPLGDNDPNWRERLSSDGLYASIVDILAAEAANKTADATTALTRGATQNNEEDAAPSKPGTSHEWNEQAIRRLREEFLAPGATQASLARQYQLSRQRIGQLLKIAEEKYGSKKASAFAPIITMGKK